jgi:hypothetical protein
LTTFLHTRDFTSDSFYFITFNIASFSILSASFFFYDDDFGNYYNGASNSREVHSLAKQPGLCPVKQLKLGYYFNTGNLKA